MRSIVPFWVDRFFDEAATPTFARYSENDFVPATEVHESDKRYSVSVDLPGMKKDDIKIEVADSMLKISGERKHESRTDEHKLSRIEKTYGYFSRSFSLPSTVATDKIEARYEDGVLELILPKAEAAQPRKIEIQSGKSGGFFN